MKRTYLILLIAMMSIVTTGCMKAILRFEPDGSGQLEIGFNMSVQSLEEADSMSDSSSSDGLDEISNLLESGEAFVDEKTGISVTAEERLENGSMWTYMILHIPTIEAWAYLKKTGDNFITSDSDDDSPADPSTFTAIPNVTVDGNTVRVELTVPSEIDPDARTEDDPFGMSAIMGAFVQVSYEIDMPGTVVEHNGQIDTLTGNPVWIIDMTSPDDLEIVVESTTD